MFCRKGKEGGPKRRGDGLHQGHGQEPQHRHRGCRSQAREGGVQPRAAGGLDHPPEQAVAAMVTAYTADPPLRSEQEGRAWSARMIHESTVLLHMAGAVNARGLPSSALSAKPPVSGDPDPVWIEVISSSTCENARKSPIPTRAKAHAAIISETNFTPGIPSSSLIRQGAVKHLPEIQL